MATPILDLTSLRQLLGDDHVAIAAVLDKFIANSGPAIADIAQLISRLAPGASMSDLAQLAHRLKGASATVGASALQEVARVIEFAARAGDLGAAQQAAAGLTEALEALKGTTAKMLQS